MQDKTDKNKAGFVKIHRSLFDNPLFTKYPEFIGPWVWMIAEARFKANGIGRGQLRLSKRELHKKFTYLSVTKCERFLGHCVGHNMIEIEPQNGTQLSVITICNYEKYQHLEKTSEPQGGPQELKTGPLRGPSYKNVSKNDKNVKEKSTRGTRLPADWKLPKSWGQWALENRSDFSEAIVRDIAEQFRDHWLSASGQNANKRDWFATWRNWCRRQKIQNQQQSTQEKGGVYALLESEGYFQ